MVDVGADLGAGRATFLRGRLLVTIRAVLLTVALTMQFGVYGHLLFTGWPGGGTDAAIYAVIAVTGLGCAAILVIRGHIPAIDRWMGTAVLFGCSVVTSLVLPPDAVELAEHWSFSVIGWHALALLFDVSLWWFVGFCVAHVWATIWPAFAAGSSVPDLAAMAIVVVAVVGFQIGVALSTKVVRAIADAAAETSLAEEQLAVQEEAAAAAARNRERRYADLRVTTLPLLAGLADGRLDPQDAVVRRRCAVEASRMRRLFSETEAADDRLLHELGAAIDVADRHGTTVHLSVRGDPIDVPQPVRRELLAPVAEALVTTGSEARLTVVYGPDRVRVSVLCGAPDFPVTSSGDKGVDQTASISDGRLWLETSWRSP
jgi:hypothetical protein